MLEQFQLLNVISRSWVVRDTFATKRNERNERNETNERESKSSKADRDSPTPRQRKTTHWLVEIWNQFSGDLKKCRIPISESRLSKIKVRVKSSPEKSDWIEAVQKVSESKFCNGDNDRGWTATFDWLLKPDTLEKVLEGKYENSPAKKSGKVPGYERSQGELTKEQMLGDMYVPEIEQSEANQ